MVVFRYSRFVMVALLACGILGFSGCGTVRTVGEKISPVDLVKKMMPRTAQLNKRVMLFEPVDQAGYGPEVTSGIAAEMRTMIKDNSRFIVEKPPEGLEWKDAGLDLRIAAPVDLLDFCREEGISTIVTLMLSPVESAPKTTGIWPFRTQSIVFSIPVRLTALDVVNGTVLLTQSVVEEDVIKLFDAEMSTDRELLDRFASRIIPRIVARQVRELMEEMDRWLWRGSILAVEENNVIINAGTDLGIKKGSRFEVLGEGETILARDGRTLTIPGVAAGELIVTEPGARKSLAEPTDDAHLEPGLIIRYKP